MRASRRGILGLGAALACALGARGATPGVAVSDSIEIRGSGRIESVSGPAIVSTNSTGANKIIVRWGGLIDGDAYVGVGGDPNTGILTDANYLISGVRGSLDAGVDIDAVSPPAFGGKFKAYSYSSGTVDWNKSLRTKSVTVGGSTTLRITDHIVVLAEGQFTVSGGARVEVMEGASLTIYAKAGFRVIEGGMVNVNTGDPALCSVYGVGAQQMEISGGTRCVARVRGHLIDLRIVGSGRLTGSYMGRSLYMEGGGVLSIDQGLRFTDVSSATGFGVDTSADADFGSGLHWGDLNNDGFLDAIVTGESLSRRLMNNAGNTFTVSTMGGGTVYRQGGLLDLDHDDDLDFWGMTHANTEAAYLNDGSGGMANAGHLGMPNASGMEGVAIADTDADGWADVIVFAANGNWIGQSQGSDPVGLVGSIDAMLGLNDAGDRGDGDYCSSADVNNDGHLDFFYHFSGGKLFVSNGDGTYTQNNFGISVATGSDDKVGSAWGDYDNDGDADLWVSRHDSGSTGYLWRNNVDWTSGTGTFSDVSASAGVTNTLGTRGCAWGDYDNDGDLDLYLATRGDGAANVLYANNGDATFTLADVGADCAGDAQDAVFVDYDNDGDLDLGITHAGAPAVLLRNDTDTDAYLKVRVLGAGAGKTNKAGVGVRVELWSQDGSAYLGRREIGAARGFGGTEPMWAHFGGVDPGVPYMVKAFFTGGFVYEGIVTPGDVSTTIGATTIEQMLTIDESEVRASARIVEWDEIAPH